MKSSLSTILRALKRMLQNSLLRKTLRGGLITSIALLTSCVNNVDVGDTNTHPTLGAQLMDLEQAHQAGAISKDEYQRLRLNLFRKRSG